MRRNRHDPSSLASRSAQDQPGNPMPEYIAVFLHAVSILLGYGRHLLDTVQPPRRRPHIPHHRGMLRHRQPLHHPRPPQPRHPACRRAGALPARARRNRPRHQHRDPPHPHGRNTARASRPPGRATSGPASQAQSQATPVAAPRPGRSRTLHAHTGGTRSSGPPPRSRPHHRRDLQRSRRRPRPSAPPPSGATYSRSSITSAATS